MEEVQKEQVNLKLDSDLQKQKDKLKKRIDEIIGSDKSAYFYKRRLETIFNTIKDKLLYDDSCRKMLKSADFFQKIEMFMNYDEEKVEFGEEKKSVITTDIYSVISEVFKSLYINFILSFLEEEPDFMVPYIGRIRIKEVDRFNPLFKKNLHFFFGRIYLDKSLREDLKRIDKEEKLSIIDSALDRTRKILKEKIY